MTDQTIAEIARKLTAAQKRALLEARPRGFGAGPDLVAFGRSNTNSSLLGAGLVTFTKLLTPTGLAVRAYLQEQNG